jgi:YHS domain-containing protein
MRIIRNIIATIITVAVLTAPLAGFAGAKPYKPKPDLLTTCPVSGDKLGEMGKPFIFEHQGQEVKLCCKNCKKDFDKDPAKYMKLIREADKQDKSGPAKKDARN